jgi:hypothetical protein
MEHDVPRCVSDAKAVLYLAVARGVLHPFCISRHEMKGDVNASDADELIPLHDATLEASRGAAAALLDS